MKNNSFRKHLHEELRKPQFIEDFVNAAIKEGDNDTLKIVLNEVVKVVGIEQVSKKSNISRQSLYRMLLPSGNPNYNNLTSILDALGLQLKVAAKPRRRKSQTITDANM